MSKPYKRGDSPFWWIAWTDAHGKRQQASSGTADLARAKVLLAKVQAEVKAERNLVGSTPAERRTVDEQRQEWERRLAARGVVEAKRESARLANHGGELLKMRVRDVTREDVLRWVDGLRGQREPDGSPTHAPRTIRAIYSTLRAMLQDAVTLDKLPSNPCTLSSRRNELPAKIDKDPTWRRLAVFSRAEMLALVTDPRLPWWRRVLNGLLFLGGMRIGEALARRWSEIDTAREPLACLFIPVSYSTRRRSEGHTKAKRPREMPIHPLLDAMLAGWAARGWAELVGREPKLGDLIVPSRTGGHRDADSCQVKFNEDCDALGLRRRRQHDGRRTFISIARGDGANEGLLRWVTHGPRGEVIDDYTSPPWADLCREVARLKTPRLGTSTLAATSLLRASVTAGDFMLTAQCPGEDSTLRNEPSESTAVHEAPEVAGFAHDRPADAPQRSNVAPRPYAPPALVSENGSPKAARAIRRARRAGR